MDAITHLIRLVEVVFGDLLPYIVSAPLILIGFYPFLGEGGSARGMTFIVLGFLPFVIIGSIFVAVSRSLYFVPLMWLLFVWFILALMKFDQDNNLGWFFEKKASK